jgi:hypothetical protein
MGRWHDRRGDAGQASWNWAFEAWANDVDAGPGTLPWRDRWRIRQSSRRRVRVSSNQRRADGGAAVQRGGRGSQRHRSVLGQVSRQWERGTKTGAARFCAPAPSLESRAYVTAAATPTPRRTTPHAPHHTRLSTHGHRHTHRHTDTQAHLQTHRHRPTRRFAPSDALPGRPQPIKTPRRPHLLRLGLRDSHWF